MTNLNQTRMTGLVFYVDVILLAVLSHNGMRLCSFARSRDLTLDDSAHVRLPSSIGIDMYMEDSGIFKHSIFSS